MEKMIFFESDCSGQYYDDFLDYAFSSNDYFMLVYVNYKQRGYTQTQSYFKKALSPYKVKTRTNPSWPGTLRTIRPNATYQIVFYRTDDEAKKYLRKCVLCGTGLPRKMQKISLFLKVISVGFIQLVMKKLLPLFMQIKTIGFS